MCPQDFHELKFQCKPFLRLRSVLNKKQNRRLESVSLIVILMLSIFPQFKVSVKVKGNLFMYVKMTHSVIK